MTEEIREKGDEVEAWADSLDSALTDVQDALNRLDELEECQTCHGTGTGVEIPCPDCQGQGKQQTGEDSWEDCPECHGEGKLTLKECPDCSGQGLTEETLDSLDGILTEAADAVNSALDEFSL